MGQDNAELIAEAREWAFVNAVADRPEADVLRRLADALERVTPRGDDWEYGCSWLEGQERVYGIRDDEWTAKNDLYRMNLGYPYPEENYLVRRHSATSWEPFTPTGKETE